MPLADLQPWDWVCITIEYPYTVVRAQVGSVSPDFFTIWIGSQFWLSQEIFIDERSRFAIDKCTASSPIGEPVELRCTVKKLIPRFEGTNND